MVGLGINLAYYDFGADFGPELVGKERPSWRLKVESQSSPSAASPSAPAGSTPSSAKAYATDTDLPETTKLYWELKFLQSIGVKYVRWYLLGDGGIFSKSQLSKSSGPLDIPREMPDPWTKDFRYALKVFQAAGIQMIPVLMDFAFAHKPKIVFNDREYPVPFSYWRDGNLGALKAGGLAAFVVELQKALGPPVSAITPDPGVYLKAGRSDWLMPKSRDAFIGLLQSIIKVPEQLASAVYAWEIMSEPDGACSDYNPMGDIYVGGFDGGYKILPVQRRSGGTAPGFEATALDDFLWKALGAFAKSHPTSKFTIGFNSPEALLARLSGDYKSLYQAMMQAGTFVPAFHYYPENYNWVSSRTESNIESASVTGVGFQQRKLADIQQVLAGPLRGARALLVGELATTDDFQGMEKTTWPDSTGPAQWGGAALLERLNMLDTQLSKLAAEVTVLPWAYSSGGARSGFTLRHAAAMAKYSENSKTAALLDNLAPDGPTDPST